MSNQTNSEVRAISEPIYFDIQNLLTKEAYEALLKNDITNTSPEFVNLMKVLNSIQFTKYGIMILER